MTQEDKELLLKDLCARLPYKTMVQVPSRMFYGEELEAYPDYLNPSMLERLGTALKPYLRPMSSMTEKEKKELENYLAAEVISSHSGLNETLRAQRFTTNFLYSKHLDVLGLIEKGLALEAPEDMYKED